ncbi:RNA polymerase sigma factor [Amphiplicatus metriothermophilus]|uniref:RNA polymerase sigma-70 factor, ECF subfamily n=1 Tax=Amphiplicatus metriothermophilus TaxID=1519374 RepID=A0A239PRD1_9PROT|nr:RNA polymerase sigma factor [Amphiplicatus metriothermophilus]MBB5518389.1 RNA polymerase sigma-70 factor (ECF subfamily) [Amphiplicatus metriothermophilus]SNT72446.1 RNA polymerase sigma-70 factor, ECF subfamily [Amphiplicatus metriothermophilus]
MDAQRKELVDCIPRLRRFALALAGDQSDADDLVQAAVERALRRLDGFRQDGRMDSWLFKIAQNLWIDGQRARRRRGRHVELEFAHDLVGEDGRRAAEQRAAVADARAAIARLPEAQRLVVAYVLVDGQSYRDAAANLGVPVGTVMSRLARARKTLEQAILGEDGSDDQNQR